MMHVMLSGFILSFQETDDGKIDFGVHRPLSQRNLVAMMQAAMQKF